MEANQAPQTFGEMLQYFAQQQEQFHARMNEQIASQAARMETLTSKPPVARKAEPPKYHRILNEDLELWFFTVEQYYADYHPLTVENSAAFVTMVSCYLAPTPMNWYRQFVADCDRAQVVRTWETFKVAMRKRFLPPRIMSTLCVRSCCKVPSSPLELRFYFQQGLRSETAHHLREHHPATLDETIELSLRFDHGVKGGSTPSATAEWVQRATCHKCKQVGHIAPQCPSTK